LKKYAIDAGAHFKQSEIPVDKALPLKVILIDKEILRITRRRRGSLVLFNVANYK